MKPNSAKKPSVLTNRKLLIGIVLILAVILFLSLRTSTQASLDTISVEAESMSLTGGASVTNHDQASGGKYVKFAAP